MMQPSETDSLLHEPERKRKAEEIEDEEGEPVVDTEETKARCPCPICGLPVLEEDINNHLDICLNRSTVLELVRETDKKKPTKPAIKSKPARKRR
jgi:endogenous inhibitor of DNA gyrase (YacG/DUF329 family)